MTVKSKISDKDRNQPCPCGSTLKAKDCHADPVKLQLCNKVAQMYMMRLIQDERKKKGIDPYAFTCPNCKQGTDTPMKGKISNMPLCPNCEGVLTKNEPEKKEEPDADINAIHDANAAEPENKSIILES